MLFLANVSFQTAGVNSDRHDTRAWIAQKGSLFPKLVHQSALLLYRYQYVCCDCPRSRNTRNANFGISTCQQTFDLSRGARQLPDVLAWSVCRAVSSTKALIVPPMRQRSAHTNDTLPFLTLNFPSHTTRNSVETTTASGMLTFHPFPPDARRVGVGRTRSRWTTLAA